MRRSFSSTTLSRTASSPRPAKRIVLTLHWQRSHAEHVPPRAPKLRPVHDELSGLAAFSLTPALLSAHGALAPLAPALLPTAERPAHVDTVRLPKALVTLLQFAHPRIDALRRDERLLRDVSAARVPRYSTLSRARARQLSGKAKVSAFGARRAARAVDIAAASAPRMSAAGLHGPIMQPLGLRTAELACPRC
ncbi:hypothetical protein KFE25_005393 [Diacronema lutheri]|uniref:Uncharacterized protein n=1 Tax=Diacronema lutheri TaxID=2081491 RepID=A0A8J5XJI0_DIALT|nr:hypothetical protein KFE25_005393 [Diacronema lutheri]